MKKRNGMCCDICGRMPDSVKRDDGRALCVTCKQDYATLIIKGHK